MLVGDIGKPWKAPENHRACTKRLAKALSSRSYSISNDERSKRLALSGILWHLHSSSSALMAFAAVASVELPASSSFLLRSNLRRSNPRDSTPTRETLQRSAGHRRLTAVAPPRSCLEFFCGHGRVCTSPSKELYVNMFDSCREPIEHIFISLYV